MISAFFRGCVVLSVLAVLGGCSTMPKSDGRVLSFDTQVYIGDVPMKVVVFDTPEERALGLMHVESLPEGAGALFVFEEERAVDFWMKNVMFPVDMLFFDKSKRLIYKLEAVQPCLLEKCASTSIKGVRYVLEIPSNNVAYKNVVIGSRLKKQNPQIR